MTVLVVVDDIEQGTTLLAWGVRFADDQKLCMLSFCKDFTKEAATAIVERQRAEKELEFEVVSAEREESESRSKAILRAVGTHSADLLIVSKERGERAEARKLFEHAPCAILLMRVGQEPSPLPKIMVPCAGGPHANLALSVAEHAVIGGGTLCPLIITSPELGEAQAVGKRALTRIVKSAGLDPEAEHIELEVELSADVRAGIAKAAGNLKPDLLLIGASHAGVIRRTLFGSLPEKLLEREQSLSIAIMRRPWPLMDRMRARLEHWLDVTIPQLEREDRIALFDRIQSGSHWNFDFMTLIALSTAIAALGLLQNSAAVVIGAMLVAPLMTPILGAGLALVQGNLPLMRSSVRTISLGFLCAVAIGYALGWMVPLHELTSELRARGGPTLLDLGVAFLSGFAAAYCVGRPTLSAALPGVAIAAALVPPVATIGVSLALGKMGNAQGAALLFGTNVVAITLGAALSLYAGGIRGRSDGDRRWVRWVIAVLMVLTLGLAVPLSSLLTANLRQAAGGQVKPELVELIQACAAKDAKIELLKIEKKRPNGNAVLVIQILTSAPVQEKHLQTIFNELYHEASKQELKVRIETVLGAVLKPQEILAPAD